MIPAHIMSELRTQLRTSIPATLSMLLYRIPWLVSLVFVGSIGSKELAAAALATTLCNVTGMSLSVGLSTAITTLTGQARGELLARGEGKSILLRQNKEIEENEERKESSCCDESTPLKTISNSSDATSDAFHTTTHVDDAVDDDIDDGSTPNLPLVFLYRGILIQLAFVLPVGFYWLHGFKPVLLYLGQGEELSTMTQQYLRILTPGLWAYSINWTLTVWLQVIEMAHVPMYGALFGGILHVPMNLFFIHVMGWGWLGVGVATTLYQVIQPIVTIMFLAGTKHGRSKVLENIGVSSGTGKSHVPFWREAKAAICSLSGIFQYLKLALPGILIISEWWASEICIFLSGKLSPNPDIALGAMAVYQSLNSSCFMFPMGMSIGGSARIGKQLGSGDSNGARLSAIVCVAGAGLLSGVMGSMLYFTPHSVFPSLFTSDANLIDMTSKIIPLLSIYVIGDGFQVALNSAVKGCGRQCVVVPIVIIAYWCVALPLAWHLAFVRSGGTTDCVDKSLCGIVGLVTGMTVGTWVHFILLAIYCVFMIDWQLEAKMAKERLGLEKEAHYREIDDENITP